MASPDAGHGILLIGKGVATAGEPHDVGRTDSAFYASSTKDRCPDATDVEETIMRISHLRIWVDDMAAARRFYGETLGLESPWNWGDAAIGFNLSNAQLIVEPEDGSHEGERLSGRFVGCTIQVDDIDATYDEWTARGVEFDSPPEDAPGIGRMASFRDPAGNVFTLYENRKVVPVRRRTARRR